MFGSTYATKLAPGESVGENLVHRGVDRREFLAFCRDMSIVLGLGTAATPKVAKALQAVKRPTVIWLELQECTGCVESILRANDPTIGNLLLDVISLDYSETLMAGAGHQVEQAKADSMKANKGSYVLVVTGSIPLNENGIYAMVAGRTARDTLIEAAEGAAAARRCPRRSRRRWCTSSPSARCRRRTARAGRSSRTAPASTTSARAAATSTPASS